MRFALFVCIFMLAGISQVFADSASEKEELAAVGQRLLNSRKSGKLDVSCVTAKSRDLCMTGALHLDRNKDEVKVTGDQFKAYFDSLKKIDLAEDACQKSLLKDGQQSKDWKDYDKTIKCLRGIRYDVAEPKGIKLFYIETGELFSQFDIERAIESLTSVMHELNPSLKNTDVEDGKVDAEQKAFLKKEKQDKILYPDLLPASAYIANQKTHSGKLFKAVVRGRGVIAFSPNRDSFSQGSVIPDCNFSYLNTDADFGKAAGNGHYRFEGEFHACNQIEGIEEHPTNAQQVLVKFIGVSKVVTNQGQQLTLPRFKMVGFENENKWLDTRGGIFNPKDTIK